MASTSTKPAVNLESELTCSICTELLYQPLTLLDCLHTFCGACLKEWFSWQAIRAENAPVPPAPDVAVFTCPSCRDRVRDTKHDARVATLLEMYLALNPDRVKAEDERAEMDRKYKKGEKVLPKLSFLERTPEQKRLDAEERRLLEEVQQLSLRDALSAAERADRGGRAGGRETSVDGRRGERRARRERDESRRRAHSATLHADHAHAEDGRRRRSESRNRVAAATATSATTGEAAAAVEAMRVRHVEHQSSLRSLISSEGIGTRDIEREIEEFTRQIQEEGLLDGLDLDNINLRDNDELSKRITEAYRRRYRDRSRQEGGRRSNASAHSHRSDLSAGLRPRALTGENSRPSSRHGGHASRPPSANSSDERGRYPPSSSTHLDVHEHGRRRRTPSGGRSATVPVASVQPESRGGTVRSQTDLAIRPSAGIIAADARSSSSPTTVTPTRTGRGDSPENKNASFNARAAAGLGISQSASQTDTSSDSDKGSGRKRAPVRPASLALDHIPAASASFGAGSSTPPLSSPRRTQPPRYKEPLINCDRCGKQHLEYEVHYNCSTCRGGDWNICLNCYRDRKGCLHWLGFGQTAWERWKRLRANGDPKWASPPHFLYANRYLPPKLSPGGADGRRVFTMEDPLERLQSGTFCCRCAAWTNDCYWQCDACNEGEWGFCSDCVGQGFACTHDLLPIQLVTQAAPTEAATTPPASPGGSRPTPQTTQATQRVFRPAVVVRPCSVCRRRIPGPEPRFHCHTCTSDAIPDARPGDYDICKACYASTVASEDVAVENGPAGWRRCPKAGHRMVIECFVPDLGRGGERHRPLHDLVGGRRLSMTPYEGGEEGLQAWGWKDSAGHEVLRLVAVDVGVSTEGVAPSSKDKDASRFTKTGFPLDGDAAPKAIAGWGWYPRSGVGDELMFPKRAEILEVEDVNGEWFHGFYMGASGLFPAPYVTLEKRSGNAGEVIKGGGG